MEGNRERNDFFDTAKGVLITLVIVGHVLLGTLQENPVRYLIYSFHMPAFFFVSGYLINTKRLSTESFSRLAKRYLTRIIVPWVLAIQAYYVVVHIWVYGDYSVSSYLKSYIAPYYHLWFSVGYLFCVTVTSVFAKGLGLKRGIISSLFTGGIIMLLHLILPGLIADNSLILFFEHTIRPWFLWFFCLGILARNPSYYCLVKWQSLAYQSRWLALVCFIVFLPIGYYHQGTTDFAIRFFLLSIVFMGVQWDKVNVRVRFFSKLGRETYPLYLWHVVGCELGALTPYYYLVSFLWVLFLILLLKYLPEASTSRMILGR